MWDEVECDVARWQWEGRKGTKISFIFNLISSTQLRDYRHSLDFGSPFLRYIFFLMDHIRLSRKIYYLIFHKSTRYLLVFRRKIYRNKYKNYFHLLRFDILTYYKEQCQVAICDPMEREASVHCLSTLHNEIQKNETKWNCVKLSCSQVDILRDHQQMRNYHIPLDSIFFFSLRKTFPQFYILFDNVGWCGRKDEKRKIEKENH